MQMKEELINNDSACSICKNPFADPGESKDELGKPIFCHQCIEKEIKSDPSYNLRVDAAKLSLRQKFVSVDTTQFDKNDESNKRDLFRLITSHFNFIKYPVTNIACPASNIGCSWEGPPEQIKEHRKTCTLSALKPIFGGFTTYVEQWEDAVNQQTEQLKSIEIENKQLEQRLKPQGSIVVPLGADAPHSFQENDLNFTITKYKVPAPPETIDSISLQKFMNQMDKYRIEVDAIFNECDEKEKTIVFLMRENQSLKIELERRKKTLKNNSQSNCILNSIKVSLDAEQIF